MRGMLAAGRRPGDCWRVATHDAKNYIIDKYWKALRLWILLVFVELSQWTKKNRIIPISSAMLSRCSLLLESIFSLPLPRE